MSGRRESRHQLFFGVLQENEAGLSSAVRSLCRMRRQVQLRLQTCSVSEVFCSQLWNVSQMRVFPRPHKVRPNVSTLWNPLWLVEYNQVLFIAIIAFKIYNHLMIFCQLRVDAARAKVSTTRACWTTWDWSGNTGATSARRKYTTQADQNLPLQRSR